MPTSVRARLNGAITGVQSGLQTFIPTIAGMLFAWAITHLPHGNHITFVFGAMVNLTMSALARLILPAGK